MSAHSSHRSELRQRNIGSQVCVDVIEDSLQEVPWQTASVRFRDIVLRGIASEKIYSEGIGKRISIKPSSGGAFIEIGRHREKYCHDVPVRQIPVFRQFDVGARDGLIQSSGEQAGMDGNGNSLSGTSPSELVNRAARKDEGGSRPRLEPERFATRRDLIFDRSAQNQMNEMLAVLVAWDYDRRVGIIFQRHSRPAHASARVGGASVDERLDTPFPYNFDSGENHTLMRSTPMQDGLSI